MIIESTTTDTEQSPISFAVRCACDIATGATVDTSATGISARGSWRDLNAKGNGSETYRRALSPGASWRFVASERLPRGTFLACERKAVLRGDVYVGDLIADYDRSLSHGKSQGEARHDGKIGLVTGTTDKGPAVEWLDVAHLKDGTWRVILPTGAHLAFPSPAWPVCIKVSALPYTTLRCYACEAEACGVRDRRPEGGIVEAGCARHADPTIRAYAACFMCHGTRPTVVIDGDLLVHKKCHAEGCAGYR